MKIKKYKLYTVMFYIMLLAYMLGPALSQHTGIPRIENPLTILFNGIMLLSALSDTRYMQARAFPALLAVGVMGAWSGLHLLVSPLTQVQFMDIMFFMSLPCLFLLLYLILTRHPQPLYFIRRFLIILTLFIVVPPAVEILTGFQFVSSIEQLDLGSGVVKGLFFNPNNLGTTALCFSTAVLFFFNFQADAKEKKQGWVLFLLLGMVVFASASRTATLCYTILLVTTLIYRGNALLTGLMLTAGGLLLSLIPKEAIGSFLLSLNGNIFLENISSRLYLFLFDLESDNSVGYRQEIYNYFWHNPPFLLLGYGPKNFEQYFGGQLSMALGFANPHSFIIELYLGFGLTAFAAFAFYVVYYLIQTALNHHLNSKQRLIAFISMGVFLLAGFIPSTILRMPFIWLPCFMIFLCSILLTTKPDGSATNQHAHTELPQ